MTVYRCQCGFAEIAQDKAPYTCSACPRCRTLLTEGGVGTDKAHPHRIVGGRCETCGRPEELLRAIGATGDRIERVS